MDDVIVKEGDKTPRYTAAKLMRGPDGSQFTAKLTIVKTTSDDLETENTLEVHHSLGTVDFKFTLGLAVGPRIEEPDPPGKFRI